MQKKNIFYAQSGGPTSVINTSAYGVIKEAIKHPNLIGKVFAGKDGIYGALSEELIDTSIESKESIELLMHTPGAAFGSCRYKLKNIKNSIIEYQRIIEVFKAHNIGYFLYNGGGDSQDTTNKISQISSSLGYPIKCIGIPKTIDNDLPFTDTSPGFGSAAKYIAISVKEASIDLKSMSQSTKVFILEVMGRNSGWIAAASGLIKQYSTAPPHIILFPEIPFDKLKFCIKVKNCVEQNKYCVIVVAEGIKSIKNQPLTSTDNIDSFGNKQLGGIALTIANVIRKNLGYKCHLSVSDYLQRSARHIASQTDVNQAYIVGKSAVQFALKGKNAIMPTIIRERHSPYKWKIGQIELSKVANTEKKLPKNFITKDGFGITKECYNYLQPLIQGESYPPYHNGIPQYAALMNRLTPPKLKYF